ncbi:hypothetical protein BDP81DRAFT_496810, partial [Colletotrichum phormii]
MLASTILPWLACLLANMRRTFESIRIRLMVGIGGGVPGNINIRLGDVVVCDKVLQYDLGKIITGNRVQRTGTARVPPQILLNAVSKLRAIHETRPSEIPAILQDMHKRHHNMAEYVCPSLDEDRLFRATYDHEGSNNCKNCSLAEIQHRDRRATCHQRIHFGGIASGNQVGKCGRTRDALAKELKKLCFEMEAAGLMDNFPCLVIKGRAGRNADMVYTNLNYIT